MAPHLRPYPASFGQRFAAWLLDNLIIGVPTWVGVVALRSLVPTETTRCPNGFSICEEPTSAGVAIIAIFIVAGIVVTLWYYGEFDGRRGATLGRRIMKIKLVRAGTQDTVGFRRALGRLLATGVSGSICYLGYFWMLWDDESQTWHDKIVDTQVIQA